jgi:hypothetical protein
MVEKTGDGTPTPADIKRDPLLGPSGFERDASGAPGTRAPEDYPIDEKITPPAEQTGAARPTVIGVAADSDEPGTEPGLVDEEQTKDPTAPKAPAKK